MPSMVSACTCCGELLRPGADICPLCHTDLATDGSLTSPAARMSLVLGLLGISVLPIVFSAPAVAFAVRARREIRRTPGMHGSESAGWGLALGVAGNLLGVILLASVVAGRIL
jgi:Domain of unknown function (DUF4190)